jgi:hypothetical protein
MPHPNVELWYEPEDVMESPLRLTAHGGFGGGGEPDAYSAYANSPILQKGCSRSTSPAAYSTLRGRDGGNTVLLPGEVPDG